MEIGTKQNEEQLFLEQYEVHNNFSPLFRQIYTSLGALILALSAGMTMGYSAILLPQLEDQNSSIKITTNQGSWIASMIAIPATIGSLISGFLMERIGRKHTLTTSGIMYSIGWSLIGAAQNIEMVIAGRLITGLSVGLIGPIASIYIGETAAPKYRGFLLSAISVGVSIGVFWTHLLGIFLTWQVVAYLSVLLPCLAIVIMIFVPESPTWLANKGRTEEAQKAFVWCRGYAIEARDELSAMLKKEKTITQEKTSWGQYKNKEFWQPLVIMAVFVITMQLSGVNAISFYTVSLMQNAVGENMDKYAAMMIIDTIRLIMSIVACVLVRKFGRRPLNNLSVVGTVTSLFGLSGFLYFSKMDPELSKYSFIPIVCLVSYIIFVSVGLVQLPWIVVGEIFPRNMKGVGGALTTTINSTFLFLVVKTNPIMNLHLQQYGSFFIYGCLTVIGGLFLYFYLPETKGKTLQEIQEYFEDEQTKTQPDKNFIQ